MSGLSNRQIRLLVSDKGGRATRAVHALTEPVGPAEMEKLRAEFGAELAGAAISLADLRRRASHRFRLADRMYFSCQEAVEQATSEAAARHKAKRFANLQVVADLCCGIGGDTLALADADRAVLGVDLDPARLLCLRANADAYAVSGRVRLVAADVGRWVPRADAYHVDGPRRDAGGRRVRAGEWQKWIDLVRSLRDERQNVAGKFSPAIELRRLDWADEIEFISENRTLTQAVAWCGRLARHRRSATVLRSNKGVVSACESIGSDRPAREPAVASGLEPGRILYEPDAAVVRAELLGNLAERLAAGLIDPHLPLLAGEGEQAATLLARAYRVLEVVGWSAVKVKQLLGERGWEAGEVKTRAFAGRPEQILAALQTGKSTPKRCGVTVWAVRLGDKPTCILTERLQASQRLCEPDRRDNV